MEVSPGYRQTNAGVVPEDWDVKLLRELSSCFSGGTPSTSNRSYYGGDIPWITSSDLNKARITDVDGRITKEGLANSAAKTVDEGTLLLALYGATAGVSAVTAIRGAINQAVLAIIPKRMQSEFLFQLLRHRKESLIATYTQGGQPNLSGEIVKSFAIPCPPETEQRAISAVLGDVDALLSGLDCLIAKKRDLKQAAMQQLLTGQTRLPGFQGEWETRLLPDLADIRSGGTPSTNDPAAWDGDIAWCTPTDITALAGRKYLTSTARLITAHGLKQSSAEVIPAGSVVMTSRATIGECAINTIPMTTNQGFKNFVPFESVDAEFLYYLLTTQKAGFISLCGGSTFLEIGKTQLRGYGVLVPADKAEQTAIAAVLSDMDAELTALEARRGKTRALKQGMMQELLSGRTRLV